jgi:hypothetical protein
MLTTVSERGECANGEKNKERNPHRELKTKAILARLRHTEYVEPEPHNARAFECSYARSSQRNLRETMNSMNQKSAKTTSTILSAFIASWATI